MCCAWGVIQPPSPPRPWVNHQTTPTPTFVAVHTPRGGTRRVRQAHVVLGKDAEVVLSPGLNVDGGVRVAEEAVRYVLPHPGAGLVLRHHVVQPVVQLLVRGGGPGEDNFALDGLLDRHRPRALGLVWTRRIMREISSALFIRSGGYEGLVWTVSLLTAVSAHRSVFSSVFYGCVWAWWVACHL